MKMVEYQGYDIYFGNQSWWRDLGVDVNYIHRGGKQNRIFTRREKLDIILANFTVTDDVREEVDFALPLIYECGAWRGIS